MSDTQATIMRAPDAQGMEFDLKSCMTANESFDSVQADVLEGSSVGVATTPTIFLNGEIFVGIPPKDVFAARITEALHTKAARARPRTDRII